MTKNLIPNKKDEPAKWYTAVVQLAELSDYGPSKGTMIIRPYGYAIWENVQKVFDEMIKDYGVDNAYFPIFIPMSYIEKEKSHVDGFAPELAIVTHGGGQKLEEPLVIRPTSETIINASFTKWVQSHRDLPIKLNQWSNAVRWEKRTLPFLRTTEFLWQEGHTIHSTHEEAKAMQKYAMDSYAKLYREYYALDGYVGRKSRMETFAGADETLTFETMMPSGKALQSCTSHDLGQNFAKAFDTKFQDEDGEEKFVWQTSWGLSTRSIGGLILGHGDDNGLVLPPRLAPKQVVIVPVKSNERLVAFSNELKATLRQAGIRADVDDRDDESFGYKLNKWDVKGVPVIFKIGEKEAADKTVTAKRRDTGEENHFAASDTAQETAKLLEIIQADLLVKSRQVRDENTREASTYEEMKQILAEHKGFVKVFWNDNSEIEAKIKEETKAVSRCCIETGKKGTDFYTGKPATEVWLFAQSY
ncbi:MAG: proline--tRNA ligase [Candidatus Saccharibacteria bacterium]|nr:proline--tRNA ligase [Candidatus Saccharibacteria bacterium]